jgi:hypothetical protein
MVNYRRKKSASFDLSKRYCISPAASNTRVRALLDPRGSLVNGFSYDEKQGKGSYDFGSEGSDSEREKP